MNRYFGNFFSPILLFNLDVHFFYNINIIYFISHEGYIPTSEAPNLIDPPPVYHVYRCLFVFFVCLFAFFLRKKIQTDQHKGRFHSYLNECLHFSILLLRLLLLL